MARNSFINKVLEATGAKAKNTEKKAEHGVNKVMDKIKKGVLSIPRRLMAIPFTPLRLIAITAVLFVIVLLAVMIQEAMLDTVEAVYYNGTESVISSKGENLSDEDQVAVDNYKSSGTYSYFSITDINSTKDYLDKLIEEDTGSNLEIYQDLAKEVGTTEINDSNKSSRVISYDDKVSIYQHMMCTSKYNFNQIKWKQYGHGVDGADSPMQENLSLGLKYPSDQNGTSCETLLDLTNKYLLSYEVPMGIYTGILSNDNISGDEAAQMAYAITKYALSDVTVNRYDCQKYDITTSYDISDFTDMTDHFQVKVVKREEDVKDEKGNKTGTVTKYDFYYVEGSLGTDSGTTTNKNSRYNDDTASEDAMKEDIEVDGATTITNKYFVKEALCLDMKFTCEVMYEKYSQDDVDNRRNADVEYVEKEEPIDTYIGEGRIETIDGGIGSTGEDNLNKLNDIASKYNCSYTSSANGNETIYTFTSNSTYQHKVGTKYYVKRSWEDTVAVTSSKTEAYKVEDLESFNENFSENPISKTDFEASTTDYNYYKSLADEEELNRIDFINSNSYIFNNYMTTIEPASQYIGYRREYLEDSAYKNVQSVLEELYDTSDTYPYEWGKTLMPNKFTSAFSSTKKSVSGRGKFIWPVPEQVGKGCISEVKGGTNEDGLLNVINAHMWGKGHAYSYEDHTGIDISTSFCQEYTVVAAADGVVVESEDRTTGNGQNAHYSYETGEYDGTYASYGKTILIKHTFTENGEEVVYYTRYAHLIQRDVQVGDEVKQGQQIGIMGNTGNVYPVPSPSNVTAGRHLHFEILDANNNHLDPVEFYNEDLSGIGGSGDTFLQYLDSYENGAVYNYLYGDTSYSSYVAKYITEDKQNFICYNDGTGKDDKNFGFGILHYLNGSYTRVEDYASVGIQIDDGSYGTVGSSLCPVDKVLQVQEMIIEEKRNLVIRCIGQDNFDKLTTQQQDCLVDIAYQGCSSWGALKTLLDSGASAEDVVNKWPRLTSTTYNNANRANARKRLWLEGIYVTASGDEL